MGVSSGCPVGSLSRVVEGGGGHGGRGDGGAPPLTPAAAAARSAHSRRRRAAPADAAAAANSRLNPEPFHAHANHWINSINYHEARKFLTLPAKF